MGQFRILGDVSVPERTVELEAANLDDLFETAARALCEVLADPGSVPDSVERTITLSAQEPEALLHHWLCELVYLKDRYREVFKSAKTRVSGGSPCCLVARLQGGVVGGARPPAQRAEAIGSCPHGLRMEPVERAYRARFIVGSRAPSLTG